MKLTSLSLDKLDWLFSHPKFQEQKFRTLLRVLLWEVFRLLNSDVMLTFDGMPFSVDCHDGIGRMLYYFGEVDKEIFLFLERFLKPGFIVVDVGANVGIYSEFAARRVQPNGIVYSFEPNADLLPRLKFNTSVGPVEILPYVVSDKCGRVKLYLSDDSAKSSILDERAAKAAIDVESKSIDFFYEERIKVGVIDYLKVDVEGNDLKVLLGAERQFAQQNVRLLQVECFVDKKQIGDFLRDNRYEIGRMMPTGVLAPIQHGETLPANLFAFTKSFAEEHLGKA